MIKPTFLWALCKTCQDSKWIGDICRNLGGQEVSLDYGQKQVADMIRMDSEWMDERINWNREAARIRQMRHREKLKDNTLSQQERDKSVTTRTNGDITPSVRPSVHPSYNDINNINTESVSVSDKVTAREESARKRNRNRDKKSSGKDWWGMEEDELRYATESMVAILNEALGSGAWRKAVQQAGEIPVKELFLIFRAECRAGEHPDNPAAAFTRRLQTDLKVDFSRKLST